MKAMVPEPRALRAVRRDTVDTFTLTLEGPAEFAPGQFNMLWAFGAGEVPISISGDPADRGSLVHTIRSVGGITRALERLEVGNTVGVRGPFGRGWPVDFARHHDVVIVAGGIGLAPLRPVVLHVLAHRDEYERVAIVVGARTPGDLLFVDDLTRWRSRFDTRVRVAVDRADRSWRGHVGLVTKLLPGLDVAPDAVAFVCGPEVMMRFVARELQQKGLDGSRICVSMERNMKCAVGVCGHCQLGRSFVCKDGPVFTYSELEPRLHVREL
ncbi:MAG: FAD/NAD(P)-binding protein [Deltaproteobacteria bacterium]|nr:FAD/NAD(P)-binding protein [Deltaproteobacteria bacterium]